MAVSRVTITGDRELRRKLRRIPEAMRTPVLQHALRKGAEPIRAAASQRAPKLTGKLAQSVEADTVSGQPEVAVTPGEAWYGAIVELGRRAGTSRTGRAYPGAIPKPFLLPAFESKKRTAIKIVRAELGQVVIREANR